jgi:cytoskeleton protein RodZ
MSEENQAVDGPAELADSAGEGPPASFGARLRWERERAGLTIADVAGRLRLHPNQVRALESEALAKLPEAAYVRGFVRGYARVFAIEPDALLADLATKIAPAGASVVDGMTQTRDYSPVSAAAREQTSRRLVVLGAVLLLIVLGALGWWATHGAVPTVTSGTVAPASPAAPGSAPATARVAESVAASGSAPSAAPPAAAESVAVMEPVPPPPLLKLRFTGPSWAEVKDAEGKPLHSQHDVAGTEFVIEGTPPFYVVIGDVANARVEVRGEAYDLAPHTRQNVARFTVN